MLKVHYIIILPIPSHCIAPETASYFTQIPHTRARTHTHTHTHTHTIIFIRHLRGKQNSGKDDELVAAKLTDGISVEFDGAGENSVDRDDDAL